MPRKISMLAIVVLLSLLAGVVAAEQRTWTNVNGLTLKAEMIRLDGDTLHLKLADNGKEIALKLSKLSPKDQAYAKLTASKKGSSSKSDSTDPDKMIAGEEPIDFNKIPRPVYSTLLQMYYAANKDVLINDRAFLLEAYAVFVEAPKKFDLSKTAYAPQLVNKKDLNEFNRPRIIKEFTEKAKAFLEKSPEWPKTGVFRMYLHCELGKYDFKAQRFPFPSFALNYTYQDINGAEHIDKRAFGVDFKKPKCVVPRVHIPAMRPAINEILRKDRWKTIPGLKFYPRFPKELFREGNSAISRESFSLLPSFSNPYFSNLINAFDLDLKGIKPVNGLPMKRELAEAFTKQFSRLSTSDPNYITKSGRLVPVELLIKVGPVVIANGQMQPIPARIFAARVLHPTTGKTIHRYKFEPDPSAVAESTAGDSSRPGRFSKEEMQGLTRLQLTLLQLKHRPELMREERLKEMTTNQIRAELKSAGVLERLKKDMASPNKSSFNSTLNPKRQIFLYDWQKLQQENNKLASGPLLDIFSGRGQAWAFMKDEEHWDDRFIAYGGITVFSPEKIKGRSIEIVTNELLPTMKKLVTAVIQKAPTRGAINASLGTVQYDPASHSLVPKGFGQPGGTTKDHNLVTLKEIVNPPFEPPKPIGGVPYAIGFAYPKSVQSLVLYAGRISSGDGETQSDSLRKILGKSFYAGGAPDAFLSYARTLAHDPVAFALDREIRIERIPIEPAMAETLTKISNWENSLQIRIILSKLAVEIAADYTNRGKTRPRGVIRGHVEGVQVETRYGLVLGYIPATRFPKISLSMKKALEEKARIPTELLPTDAPRKLTPAFIPLLIAKHQPKFFAEHIDQFIVGRLQHEYWFRKEPTKNVYGVNPATGQAFPPMDKTSDAQQRKQLVDPINAWVTKNSKTLGDQFTLQFDGVSFKSYFGGKTPAPALFYGTVITPYTIYAMSSIKASLYSLKSDLFVSSVPADSNRKKTPAWHDLKDRLETLKEHLSQIPPEIYFSQRQSQFIVPDANGNRILFGNQTSSRGIAGIPVAKPTTEPIIPLLRVDKEIWIPKNGALSSTNEKPLLEVTMEITKIEIVDDPPPHPWIEAMKRYGPKNQSKKKIEDKGQYAILHVALKSAKLVGAKTGETLLPLELRDYRKVELKKAKVEKEKVKNDRKVMKKSDATFDREDSQQSLQTSVKSKGTQSDQPNFDEANPPPPSQQGSPVERYSPPGTTKVQQSPSPTASNPNDNLIPSRQSAEVNLSNPPSPTITEPNAPQQKSGSFGLVLVGLGLFAVIAVGGIVVVWRIKSSQLSTQSSGIENAHPE